MKDPEFKGSYSLKIMSQENLEKSYFDIIAFRRRSRFKQKEG